MSVLEIESLIFENTTYSFDNDDIEENDMNLETTLHSIKIFNNDYIIAMGNKNIHKTNNNLVFFVAYLIYNSKVITKIGIYELEEKDEEKKNSLTHNNVKFNELQLIIFDKYYQDRKLLEPFKQIVDNMIDTEDETIILVNDKFKFIYNENKQVDLLSSIFIDIFNKEKSNSNFSYSYLNVLRKCELNSSITVKLKEFIKKVFPKLDKKIVSKINNYINNPQISILFFVIMEMILNIKIIIVNENSTIAQFSLLGNNNLSEENKNILESKHTYYKKYNPKTVLFIKKINSDDNYHILKYNNKYTIDFANIDNELLILLNDIILKEQNEYNYNIQFEYLLNLIKDKKINKDDTDYPKEDENTQKIILDDEEGQEGEEGEEGEEGQEGEERQEGEEAEEAEEGEEGEEDEEGEEGENNYGGVEETKGQEPEISKKPDPIEVVEDEGPIDSNKEIDQSVENEKPLVVTKKTTPATTITAPKSTKQKIMEAKARMKTSKDKSETSKISATKKTSFRDKVKAKKQKE